VILRRLCAVLLALALAGCGLELPTAPPPYATAPPGADALAALTSLRVKGRAPKTGYGREQFGRAWADVDRNGCDTRNDILGRDLTALVLEPGTGGCVVLRGRLRDPYGGRVIAFVRGPRSAVVQIDHVVSLSNAWQTGAQRWSAERRERFANDPLNLLAVEGRLNQSKGDADAATWLPPRRGFRCAYASRQATVKARYGLWVTAAERAALQRLVAACPARESAARPRVSAWARSAS
jgi:hypothetical protein